MNIGQLRKFLKNKPNDMEVVMQIDDMTYVTVCEVLSEVIDIDCINEKDEEEKHTVLLLSPCQCGDEIEEGDINSQPELN